MSEIRPWWVTSDPDHPSNLLMEPVEPLMSEALGQNFGEPPPGVMIQEAPVVEPMLPMLISEAVAIAQSPDASQEDKDHAIATLRAWDELQSKPVEMPGGGAV